jgi:hypothetical protein
VPPRAAEPVEVAQDGGTDDEPPKPTEGAEVVRLDRFRKK